MAAVLSCIMPVYNAAPYLDAAIESITGQSWPFFELLLIDDGSTDSSGSLCDAWARRDERIRVIHQSNKGVSCARNAGLEAAEGRIVCFVDADDKLLPNAFASILPAFENRNRDLVSFGMAYNEDGKQALLSHPALSCDQMDLFWPHFVSYYSSGLFPSLCNKAYRTEIIKANHLRFDRTCRLGEDLEFNLAYWGFAHSFEHIDRQFYEYRILPQSLSRCVITDRMESNRKIFSKLKNFLHRQGQGQLYPLLVAALLPWQAGRFFDELLDPDQACSRSQRRAGLDRLFADEMWHAALLSELSKRTGKHSKALRFAVAHKNSWLATLGFKNNK